MDRHYVEIAAFPSRLEAEAIGHALDEHGIPFLVKSDDIGIFGPGMTGWSPGGAKLFVLEEHRAQVAELLTCVVRPLEEGELPEELDD